MEKKDRGHIAVTVLILFLFLGIILSTALTFKREIAALGLDAARQELKSVAVSNGEMIKQEYTQMVKSLNVLADNIAEDHVVDEDNIYGYIKLLADLNPFEYVGVSDEKGRALNSEGKRNNIRDREYFQEAMAGKIMISDVITSRTVKDQDIQIMAVPIMVDGEATGIVYGSLDMKIVHDSLGNITGNNIYTQIIDEKGKPVTKLQDDGWMLGYDNIWEYYRHSKFRSGSSEGIRDCMEHSRSGYYILECQGEIRITYYAPLGIGGYYTFSNLEVTQLKEIMDQINNQARHMAAGIIGAFGILIISLYFLSKSISRELRRSYEAKKNSEEILRIAADHANELVFEYDQKKRVLKRKTARENLLFPDEITRNIPEAIIEKGIMEDVSIKEFAQAFSDIRDRESTSAVVQIQFENQMEWYQILMKNIYDEKHNIINTAGVVTNITEAKRQEEMFKREKLGKERFRQKAERDGLTGLYNGRTAIEKIDKILQEKPEKRHMLVFIDLDNFKNINDTFGHHYGNQVLIEMSVIFAKNFRRNDIVARIGGDEFAVFLYDTRAYDEVEPIFKDLVEACNKVYEKDGVEVEVSASVGIALAPEHGCTYEELSQKADQALYEVKRRSKKGYQLYRPSKDERKI